MNVPWSTGPSLPEGAGETLTSFEERLMLAGRRENVTVAGPEAYTSCRAVVLTGDSNMRNILSVLAKAFENAGHTRLFKYPSQEQEKLPCNKDFPNEKCEGRWADQTWVYGPAEGGRCTVVLLFRMLHNQGALERVAKAPFDTLFCSALSASKGTASKERFAMFKTKPVCRDALKLEVSEEMLALMPTKPALVWHAHGLWGLDKFSRWFAKYGGKKKDAVDGSIFDCDTRFQDDLPVIQSLRRQGIPVVWQSNFPITGHQTITNGFLEKDVHCQRQQATAASLPMANLPQWCATPRP